MTCGESCGNTHMVMTWNKLLELKKWLNTSTYGKYFYVWEKSRQLTHDDGTYWVTIACYDLDAWTIFNLTFGS